VSFYPIEAQGQQAPSDDGTKTAPVS
jgi:hypothetical protein